MQRLKTLLSDVAERRGKDAAAKAKRYHVGSFFQNLEQSQINTMMDIHSTRFHPDLTDYNASMESFRMGPRNERTQVSNFER